MELKILHLSDLHFSYKEMAGENWPTEEFNRDIVTKSLLDYLSKRYQTESKPDLVVVTGDIAKSGKREEYRVAEVFFTQLMQSLGLAQERLYIVPGNHDVARNHIKKSHFKAFYRFDDADDVSDILGDDELLPFITRKFADFNIFTQSVMGRALFNEQDYRYADSLTLQKRGQEIVISIAGLNSCLFAGYNGDDEQKLALGLRQVKAAIDQKNDEARLSLALFHHPFECFHACDDVAREELLKGFDLLLCGHLHDPEKCTIIDNLGRAPLFGAGASFETRKSRNSFNEILINLTNGKGKVLLHKYLENKNTWNREIDLFPDNEDQAFPFNLSRLEKNPLAQLETQEPKIKTEEISRLKPEIKSETEITFVHDYLLPDAFTGRKEERKRLSEIIKTRKDPNTGKTISLASVIAIGGMGKSCLLRKVVDESGKLGKFSRLVWFSFYEVRTETEVAFFSEILSVIDPQILDEIKERDAGGVAKLRQALSRVLDREPALLLLDGLEVIQYADGETDFRHGKITDNFREVNKLLVHVCNGENSLALLSSRVGLCEFSGIAGNIEIPLHIFSKEEGAEYLKSFGIEGDDQALKYCAEIMAGHPLSLRAAGKLMKERGVAAENIQEITGDLERFKQCEEGEKVVRIIDGYREKLSPEQEHFLKMLSIHPRSVSEEHFSVLIKGYVKSGKEDKRVWQEILNPLEKLGLIEKLVDSGGKTSWSAHPLMKFAYGRWMADGERRLAYESYAKAAASSPDASSSVSQTMSLEELQPYLDAIHHYFEAGNIKAAWEIYRNKDLDFRISDLGYARILLEIGQRFEAKHEKGEWNLGEYDLNIFYNLISNACQSLQLEKHVLEYAKKMYESARRTRDNKIITSKTSFLAIFYTRFGMMSEAKTLLREINREFPEAEESYFFMAACAEIKFYSGDFEEATVLFQKAIKQSFDRRNKLIWKSNCGEALIRSGEKEAGKVLLEKALGESESFGIAEIFPRIYEKFRFLSLKRGDISQARTWENKRRELTQQLNLPFVEDTFLLVAEGDFDAAICSAETKLSTVTEEKINKEKEIAALIVLTRAWHGKKDIIKANDYLDRAAVHMEKTGCRREQDRFDETRDLLAS